MAGSEENDPTHHSGPIGRRNSPGRDRLLELCYFELHRVAEELMKNQPAGHTLQATALVSEAYLRLASGEDHHWTDRRHLIRAAAKAMRCVLIDHARRRANRQAVEGERTALDRILVSYKSRAIDLVRLEKALEELGETEPEMVRAVELRFFAGLRMEDVAEALDMPHRTLERRWALVRAWLLNRLS